MKCSIGTVMSRLFYARRRMASLLAGLKRENFGMKPDLELKLQAWLDGELPAAEAEQVRRLAAADPEAARLLAELQNIKAAFLQNEPTATVPETRPFYWSKIERQIQREAARRPLPCPVLGGAASGAGWPRLAGAAAVAAVLLVALNQSAPQVASTRFPTWRMESRPAPSAIIQPASTLSFSRKPRNRPTARATPARPHPQRRLQFHDRTGMSRPAHPNFPPAFPRAFAPGPGF